MDHATAPPALPATRPPPRLARVALWGLLAVALAVALLRARPHDVLAAVRNVGLASAALAFAICVLQGGSQLGRFIALVPPEWGLRRRRIARVISVGQLVNALAPARGGDVLNLVALRRAADGAGGSLAGSAGVLAAEKLVDIATLFALIAAFETSRLRRVLALAGPRVAAAVVLVVVAACVLALVARRARGRLREALAAHGRGLLSGLDALRRPGPALLAVATGFATWLAEASAIQVLAHAVGAPLTFSDAVWALVALNLGILVPVAPANAGTFELALALGLRACGVPAPAAAAVAVLHHALQLLATVLWAGTLRALVPVPSRAD